MFASLNGWTFQIVMMAMDALTVAVGVLLALAVSHYLFRNKRR